MLDYLKKLHPNDWPISGEDTDIVQLRKQTDHDGNPELWSKQDYIMSFKENKTLKNSKTGEFRDGGIYEALEI